MKVEDVTAYVQEQVRSLRDAKVKPLIQSIGSEELKISDHEAAIKQCNERIAAFQKDIVQANVEVDKLADRLAAAVSVAVS